MLWRGLQWVAGQFLALCSLPIRWVDLITDGFGSLYSEEDFCLNCGVFGAETTGSAPRVAWDLCRTWISAVTVLRSVGLSARLVVWRPAC